MCHPFQTNMSHMCHACEMWRPKFFFFWTASEWMTEHDICDESRVRTTLENERLKDTLRQRDDYYTQVLAQQQMMLQVSWVVSFTIEHLAILSKLIHCITTYIVNSTITMIWCATVPTSPATTSVHLLKLRYISCHLSFSCFLPLYWF
jgi:hypothetical protein